MENDSKQISDERYEIIMKRYAKFQKQLDHGEPIKVFDPLSQHLLEELELIRAASKDLQKKKEEDLSKAAQAAQQAEMEAKSKAEEAVKEAEKEDA